MMGLYRLAAETGDEEALAAAEHGLPFLRANLLRHEDWTAFVERGQDAMLGASALVAAALVQRRLATGDTGEDDLIQGLARFLRSQQQPDGSVLGTGAWRRSAPFPDQWATFGTGQALWTFALMDELFPGEGWGDAARRLARSWPRGARRWRATSSPSPTTGRRTGSPSSARGLGEPEIAYTRELAGILRPQLTPRGAERRAASGGSCAASRPPAPASGP